MIPKVLMVCVLLIAFSTAHAKKANYSFPVLIGMSDVIVTGEIESVSGDTSYLFNISENIKGNAGRQIMVKVFQNWACDVRWKKPEKGQRLFLFLIKTNNSYRSMGGSDGEIFIIENKLRLYNVFNSPISQDFKESNSPGLTDVVFAVKSFLNCYLCTSKDYRCTFTQLKTDNEVSIIKKSNAFSSWLFDGLIENFKIIKPSREISSRQ